MCKVNCQKERVVVTTLRDLKSGGNLEKPLRPAEVGVHGSELASGHIVIYMEQKTRQLGVWRNERSIR